MEQTDPPPAKVASNDQLGDAWKDALCPGCGKPASGLGIAGGWLFVCSPCGDTRWGHPQMHYGEGGAAGVLHDARRKFRQALHGNMVRSSADSCGLTFEISGHSGAKL